MTAETIIGILTEFSSFLLKRGLDSLYVAAIFAVAFIVGIVIAEIVTRIIKEIFKRGKLEERIRARGLQNALLGFNLTQIITVLLKVYIVFTFLGAATDIASVQFLTNIVQMLLNYLASFSQGVAIIVATLFVAAYITNIIKKQQRVLFAKQLALGLQIFIGYIALILALPLILPNVGGEAAILSRLLELLITAIIVAFGLAVGLSLGLGLKDPISKAAQKNQQLFDDVFSKIGKK